ncbi:SRR1-like protein [Wyeomyia smithii]|uniref:SRR1-like protein n=1 Tax=Wyeomyia smithii TaxID=174621 RepID=UPI0024681117|nr:SRR1-like protein [Wyeomyia smithii]
MSNKEQQIGGLDGFILVTASKKKRRTTQNFKCPFNIHLKNHESKKPSEESCDLGITAFLQNFKKIEENLIASDFFKEIVNLIEPLLNQAKIEAIICLGLGKLSECLISCYQLALIRCLKGKLKDFSGKIQFFDPIFTYKDIEILQLLDTAVLSENLEGKYLADQKTLFYLPHCPKQISNNLLWRNWQPELLKNVYLICNSFENIILGNPERVLNDNATYILKAEKFCKEIKFLNNFRYTDIFNDFSLHYFDTSTFFTDPGLSVEPEYKIADLELITRKIQTNLKLKNGYN